MVENQPKDTVLSVNHIKDLAHDENVGRISDDACVHIANEQEYLIRRIINQARRVAHHSGRKTVKEEDVRMVLSLHKEDIYP